MIQIHANCDATFQKCARHRLLVSKLDDLSLRLRSDHYLVLSEVRINFLHPPAHRLTPSCFNAHLKTFAFLNTPLIHDLWGSTLLSPLQVVMGQDDASLLPVMHKGGCHCRDVTFEFTASPSLVAQQCNCEYILLSNVF